MSALNAKTEHFLVQRLKQRKRELLDTLAEELSRAEEQRFVDIAGKVHDLADQSLADLLVDLDHAVVEHHLIELHEIDEAINQAQAGRYGVCTTCEEPISADRMAAYPAATRCLKCQSMIEKQSLTHPARL